MNAKKQLTRYLEEHNIIIEEQSGFRSSHSCESALSFVLYEWKMDIENNCVVVAVFLDLKRAFETLDRDILIEKLNKYGIKNKESEWFSSYLMDRKQKTRYEKEESELIPSQFGVPQGSILGPDLFNLYINDITGCIFGAKIKLFADDTLIWIAGEDINEVETK